MCELSTIGQNKIYVIIVDSGKLVQISLKLDTESEQESLHFAGSLPIASSQAGACTLGCDIDCKLLHRLGMYVRPAQDDF